MNVVVDPGCAKDSDLAHRRPGYVEITCSDYAALRERTSSDVFACYDVLAGAAASLETRRLSKAKFEALEKSMGLNFNPDGLMAAEDLRGVVDPVGSMTYDWVHCYLQDGAFTVEVTELLRACAPLGVSFSTLRAYLQDEGWHFPAASRTKSVALWRVFDQWRSSVSDPDQATSVDCMSLSRPHPRRVNIGVGFVGGLAGGLECGWVGWPAVWLVGGSGPRPGRGPQRGPGFGRAADKRLERIPGRRHRSIHRPKVKCSAGELLGLYSLLRHFVERRVGPEASVAPQLASFAAACKCLDLLLIAKRGVADAGEAAEHLAAATSDFLRLHKVAYGTGNIRPKHHWAMDVPSQVRRDGCVLDAFIVERLHLQVKAIAQHVMNTATYERTVLAGVINLHAKRLSQPLRGTGLEGRPVEWPGAKAAKRMSYLGLQVV